MAKEQIKPFKNKIWLSSPTMHGKEIEYINQAYQTNWMSTLGENIDSIEQDICKKIGTKYAVALSCGTAALHMAVKLAGVKRGDKVFCSDMTFAATVNPVVYEGGIPIFIDTEYDTWNMDPVALERAFEIYPEVKVVVVAHLYGTPSKIDEIKNICDKHNAIIIEDAAESLGATYNGIQTGMFGKYSAISFNGNKKITGSSGGMLLTNDLESAKKVRKWSTQSREDAYWYQHEQIGYNYRMSNVIAGVVRGQLPYLEEHIERKKAIYERYKQGLKDLPIKMNTYEEEKSKPNYWLSCLTINENVLCREKYSDKKVEYCQEQGKTCPAEILETLAKYNVESRPIWKPMHMQPIYKSNDFITRYGKFSETCKMCEDGKPLDIGRDIFERGLCLPSDIKMTVSEQDAIIEIIKGCF